MSPNNEPATKRDLADLEARLTQKLTDQKNELIEAYRDSETRLLKAFYGFVDSNQQHLGQLDNNQATFSTRLNTLENRVTEIEKRLNMPPAA